MNQSISLCLYFDLNQQLTGCYQQDESASQQSPMAVLLSGRVSGCLSGAGHRLDRCAEGQW